MALLNEILYLADCIIEIFYLITVLCIIIAALYYMFLLVQALFNEVGSSDRYESLIPNTLDEYKNRPVNSVFTSAYGANLDSVFNNNEYTIGRSSSYTDKYKPNNHHHHHSFSNNYDNHDDNIDYHHHRHSFSHSFSHNYDNNHDKIDYHHHHH